MRPVVKQNITDIVKTIYRAFIKADLESQGWTPLDESMSLLSELSDDQIYKESVFVFNKEKARYTYKELETEFSFNLYITIEYILQEYERTGVLVKNNRYILEYYLTLSNNQVKSL